MAKQKNTEENVAPVEGVESFQGTEPDATEANTPQQEPPAPTSPAPAPEKGEKRSVAEEPDSYTLDVLKSFPANESLYVDKHGGAFTADTPKPIRGNATLYKNPFYKK